MPRSTEERVVPEAARVLGTAIRRAYTNAPHIKKQTVLGDLLGTDQTTVSKYCNGQIAVTVERVHEIEQLCGLPRGQILAWGGALDPGLLGPENAEQRAVRASEGERGGEVVPLRPKKPAPPPPPAEPVRRAAKKRPPKPK